jgi:tetratricopeptide (TPR) repeat protein
MNGRSEWRRLAPRLLALAVAAALLGWFLGSRARGGGLEEARVLFQRGTADDLRVAAETLAAGTGACLPAARALVLAQRFAEFGEDREAAVAAVAAAQTGRDRCGDLAVAEGLVAFGSGDPDAAHAALADARSVSTPLTLAGQHHRWLAGMLALGTGDSEALERARVDARALCAEEPRTIAYHRLLALLELRAGDGDAALAALAQVRADSRTHLGLAADEALFNAALRREFSGVADLADQLLTRELGPHERAHALLARGVVHVHAGESAAALARVDTAWPLLPWWDRTARAVAMDLSLEAGDSARARAWALEVGLPEPDASIYKAWALLVDGDVMASLAALGELPQDLPRVAYLQGLALVEQRRFEEAEPWLARADRLLPGRVEIEVARARVLVHTGDKVTALRKLTGLAEEEVYAPRAYTGLGEALLAQAPERRDLRAAQRALGRAVEREPRAAEAMLLLAQVWQARRIEAPEGSRNALAWFEQAAATNPKLPRYREALARHLAELGQRARAEPMLRELVSEPGITPDTPLILADLVLSAAPGSARTPTAPPPPELAGWISTAEALGADPAALDRSRARADLALGTAASLRAAQARLERRLEQDPADVENRVLLVRVRMAQRDDEAAEALVRAGIFLAGPASSGRLFLAWAHLELRQRNRKQAALHARAALRRLLDENRPSAELLDAAAMAVTLFLKTEQPTLAGYITHDLIKRLPDSDHAWRLEARTQLESSELPRARRAATRALELGPDDPENHELRAQIAMRAGDRKTAVAALTKALTLARDDDERARIADLLRRASG